MTNADDLIRRFAASESFRWVPLSALKHGGFLACIDGRHDDCVISAPGGDFGEFILLITAIENSSGVRLDDAAIDLSLRTVMDWHGLFYLHTDEISLKELQSTLLADDRFGDTTLGTRDLRAVADLIRHPSAQVQSLLEEYLVQPRHVGCGFLKLLLMSPERLGIRRGLVESSMRSFFRALWNGSTRVMLEFLEGEHAEEAVIDIKITDEAREDTTFVPSICGCEGEPSHLFVHHRPAREYLRKENLDLLADRGYVPGNLDEADVLRRASVLAEHQLSEVISELAAELPWFEITFGEAAEAPIVREL